MNLTPAGCLAIGILFLILGVFSVAARFYVRKSRKTPLRADDWLCFVALLLVSANSLIFIIGGANGTLGSHSPPLGPGILTYHGAQFAYLETLEFPFNVMQIAALGLIKSSILMFYRRLFINKGFRILNNICLGIVVVWTVVFLIVQLAACGTRLVPGRYGTLLDLKQDCVNTFITQNTYAASDVAVDLIILATPFPVVMKLQMSRRKKAAVMGILLIGALAVGCGITRLVFFAELLGPNLFTQPYVAGLRNDDNDGIVSLLMFWGMMEIGVALFVCSLPSIRPLFVHLSLESIVNSIRSVRSSISLRLINRSGHEQDPDTHALKTVESANASEHVGPERESKETTDHAGSSAAP